MNKSSVLKVLVVVGLSMVLIASLVSVVSADDAFSGWTNAAESGNNTAPAGNSIASGNSISTGNTNVASNSISTGNTNAASNSISTGNVTTNLNTNTNTNNSSVNNLAYTGVENTSVLTVVMLLGVIVAVYSFKKIREYNNI